MKFSLFGRFLLILFLSYGSAQAAGSSGDCNLAQLDDETASVLQNGFAKNQIYWDCLVEKTRAGKVETKAVIQALQTLSETDPDGVHRQEALFYLSDLGAAHFLDRAYVRNFAAETKDSFWASGPTESEKTLIRFLAKPQHRPLLAIYYLSLPGDDEDVHAKELRKRIQKEHLLGGGMVQKHVLNLRSPSGARSSFQELVGLVDQPLKTELHGWAWFQAAGSLQLLTSDERDIAREVVAGVLEAGIYSSRQVHPDVSVGSWESSPTILSLSDSHANDVAKHDRLWGVVAHANLPVKFHQALVKEIVRRSTTALSKPQTEILALLAVSSTDPSVSLEAGKTLKKFNHLTEQTLVGMAQRKCEEEKSFAPARQARGWRRRL